LRWLENDFHKAFIISVIHINLSAERKSIFRRRKKSSVFWFET